MNDTVKKKGIVLDTSGTECPIPVLKARKLSQSLKDGSEVVVIATDPLAEQDFKHYCEESNFIYLDCVKKNNKSIIRYIYKSKTN